MSLDKGTLDQGVGVQSTDIDLGIFGILTDAGDLGSILKHDGTKYDDFARGTALQVLRVNAGGTDLEYASLPSAEFFGPWTADHNAGGFNLDNLGALISNTTNPASVGAIRLGINEEINWRNVANTADIGLRLQNDRFTMGGGLTLSGSLDMQEQQIVEGTLTSTISLQFEDPTPATTGNIRFGNNSSGIQWRNAANSANLKLTVDASDNFLFGSGLDIGTNILQFENTDTTINSVTGNLQYDVATGKAHSVRIGNTGVYSTFFNFMEFPPAVDFSFRWGGFTSRILHDAGGFEFATSAGTHDFIIGAGSEMILSTTELDVLTKKIINLVDPTLAQDAATKNYVDNIAINGIKWKDPARVATTANITLSGEQTIDGVLTSADRVLVKDQTLGENNGIYLSAAGAWTRTTDADTASEIETMAIFIQEGTVNADQGFTLTTDPPITLGTTPLVYGQFTGLGQITAGDGLIKTGNVLDVVGTAGRILVSANAVNIDTGYVGQPSITTLGTIGTGVWQGSVIASAFLDADTVHLSVPQTFTGSKIFNTNLTFLDNQLLSLGSSGDAQFKYDGTNLIITPDAVGTGIFRINQDSFNLDVPTLTASTEIVTLSNIQTLNRKTLTKFDFLEANNSPVAQFGAIRLGPEQSIAWRNNANNLDITIALISDIFDFGAPIDLRGFDINNVNFLTSNATNPATVGVIRLGNAELIQWRNAANTIDFEFGLNASDNFFIGNTLDFGGNTILNCSLYETDATNPATVGEIRLGNTETIEWRNAANTANITLTVNASDAFDMNNDLVINGRVGIQQAVDAFKTLAITIPDNAASEGFLIQEAATIGLLELTNAGGGVGGFRPQFRSLAVGSTNFMRNRIEIDPAGDTGTVPLWLLEFAQSDNTDITTRPLIRIANRSNIHWEMAVSGNIDGKGNTWDNFVVGSGVTGITNANLTAGTFSNITGVGTIGTGVWQGSVIASAFLDADTMHLSVAQSVSGAKTFQDNGILIESPDTTNPVTLINSQQTLARNLTIPILSFGDDTIATTELPQTLNFKTLTNFVFIETNNSPVAVTGAIRLGPEQSINWRNTANTQDLSIALISNIFDFGAPIDLRGNDLRNFAFLESNATIPANAGTVRLGNTEKIAWRNFENDRDVTLEVDANNNFLFISENGHANQGISLVAGTSPGGWKMLNSNPFANTFGAREQVDIDSGIDGTLNFDTRTTIVAARDTGTTPIRVNNVRLDTPAAVDVRPLYAWQNNLVDVLQINAAGEISIGVWKGSVIESAFLDADTAHLTTTQTFTGLKTFSDDVKINALKKLFLDGGVNTFISETTPDVFGITAGNVLGFTIDSAKTIKLAEWQGQVIASTFLDSDTAHLSVAQTLDLKTLTNFAFLESNATFPAVTGQIRLGDGDSIAFRNGDNQQDLIIDTEFVASNISNFRFTVENGHQGGIKLRAGTSAGSWTIRNGTPFSNTFRPIEDAIVDGADDTLNHITNTSIVAARDTGSVPIRINNVFLDTPAAVAVRPLFVWQNNSVTVLQIDADGTLDSKTHKIINVVDPTSAQDAVTKNFVDTNFAKFTDNLSVFAATTSSQLAGVISDETGSGSLVFAESPELDNPQISDFSQAQHDHRNAVNGGQLTNSALVSGVFTAITGLGAQSQALNMNTQLINNVVDPISAQDAATKNYVDNVAINGIKWKEPCRVATTANITLSGEQTIDGILTSADRVLVKDQTLGQNNGVYVSAVGAWIRSTDTDTAAEIETMATFIQEGTVNADEGFVLTTDPPIVLGTTPLVYGQFTGLGQITAGAGLTKTGNVLDVIGTTNRIDIFADNVDISSSYVGQSSITTLGTIGTGVWQGTAIASAFLDADTMHLSVAQNVTGTKTFTTGNINFNDSQGVVFGTGLDASIIHDGINLVINPDNVGTGILRIAQDTFTCDLPTLTAARSFLVSGQAQIVEADLALLSVTNAVLAGSIALSKLLTPPEANATADQTDAEIKTAYENNANTNEFDDAEQTKLAGIEALADVTDTVNVNAALATIVGTIATGVWQGTAIANGFVAQLPALGVSPSPARTTDVNLATEVTGILPSSNLDTDTAHLSVAQTLDLKTLTNFVFLETNDAAVAQTGAIRFGQNQLVSWRNTANTADLSFGVISDNFTFGASIDVNTNNLLNIGFLDIGEIATPANPAADVGRLYVKDVATVTTLFFRDNAGTETDLLEAGGEINTASNVGTGVGVFDIKNGVDLEFNSLIGGTGIDIADTVQDLTISIDSTVAVHSENLSVFAATTSAQLAGVISDETGTGLLVFGTSPTIVTPTIASFLNANHDHTAGAGGGQLTNTALTSGVFSAITGLGAQSQTLNMNSNFLDNVLVLTIAGTPAQSGRIRLGNLQEISWRNFAGTADLGIELNTVDSFEFASNIDLTTNFMDIGEIVTPANPAADVGRLYVKDVSTVTKLFFRDSAGTETDLLAGGGSSIGKHDVMLDATFFQERNTNGTAAPGGLRTRELPTNDVNIHYFEFTNAGGVQGIQGQTSLPRNFDNTNIEAFVYWTAESGTGDVAWKIKLLFRSDNDPLDAAFGAEAEIVDTFIIADDTHISSSGTLTVTGSADNDLLIIQVERDPADAQDTFTGDAQLLGIKIVQTTDAAVSA